MLERIKYRNTVFTVTQAGYCEKHGYYPLTIFNDKIGYFGFTGGCSKCARERAERERFGNVAIPPRFAAKSFADFERTPQNSEVLDYMLHYVHNAERSISLGTCVVFLGRPGTGKTHLACATAKELTRKGYTALFTSVQRMIRSIRDTWGSDVSENAAIARFTDIDFLVLDEVGVQSGSDNEAQLLFAVLNDRYENMRPTLLISNENTLSFKAYVGERIYDRLRENGGRAFIFDWDSYREGKGSAE